MVFSFLPQKRLGPEDFTILALYKKYSLKSTTTTIENINKTNPFLSMEESLHNLLSARLHEGEEYYPLVGDRKIFVASSSNGFLWFTLLSGFSHTTHYLVNPVTMEWLDLPKLEATVTDVHLGFVCKGGYPSLDLVEYTIVRLSWLENEESLLFQLLSSSSSNNEWIEYRVSCESLQVKFNLSPMHNSVIVSTTTNNQGGEGGGGSRILVYFLVMVQSTNSTAIAVVDLNEGDDKSLQMFETPGPDRGITVFYCADYIREFDDGVIHYVRFCCLTEFEFWVLNTQSGEWHLKHRTNLKMLLRYDYTMKKFNQWSKACDLPKSYEPASERYHIHAFHPMDPNLIFLTLYGKLACYNVERLETTMFEVIYDFEAQNMKYDYSHFIYQWPCWPPLL